MSARSRSRPWYRTGEERMAAAIAEYKESRRMPPEEIERLRNITPEQWAEARRQFRESYFREMAKPYAFLDAIRRKVQEAMR